jgi:hypothetical protein
MHNKIYVSEIMHVVILSLSLLISRIIIVAFEYISISTLLYIKNITVAVLSGNVYGNVGRW